MKRLMIFFMFSFLFLTKTIAGGASAFVTKNLNFRTGPSTQYMLRGLIPAGQPVFVQTCRGNWCQIVYNDQIGWVSSRYLSFKNGNDLYRTYIMFSTTDYSNYYFYP
ncbi:SH3 domain-containing protein [Bartonella sp. B10]